MSAETEGQVPRLRERNKLHKERAIRLAAKELLFKRGFEATTLRAVAEEADVGFGTVFAYAKDKSGLLAMVFVEELKALPALFDETARRDQPFDELIAALGKLYRFWAQTPILSHHVLQQMEFYSENARMSEILTRRRQVRQEIADWIAARQHSGIMIDTVAPEDAAATLFAIYASAVREWTAHMPLDEERGLATLRRLMVLPMAALTAI